jgi:predicted nucleic acid-binding protein
MLIFLDTDVLSFFLAGVETVYKRLKQTLESGNRIGLTIITIYEVLKGLRYRNNLKKYQNFTKLLDYVQVNHLTNTAVELAANTYGELRRKGITISDADIFIAAIVLENNGILVTNNEKHFQHVEGLHYEIWKPY